LKDIYEKLQSNTAHGCMQQGTFEQVKQNSLSSYQLAMNPNPTELFLTSQNPLDPGAKDRLLVGWATLNVSTSV
jgi:hypothetical protein